MATDRHGFLTWSAGFAQSDIILNDLLDKLEVKLGLSVVSRTTDAQPGAPSAGDCYIMTAGRTGAAWTTFATNDVAIYRSGAWVAFTPISGWPAWVEDDAEGVIFDGTVWTTTLVANAIVDGDFSAAEGFLRKTGAGAYEAIKSNLAATVAPTVNDDSSAGYAVGSLWLDTVAVAVYTCTDASVGAAVWATGGGLSQAEVDARVAANASLGDKKYIGQNLQTGTTYELVLGDAGKIVEMNNASPNTLTIPANASVAFPVDTRIDVVQGGAGQTTVAITTDTLRGDPKIAAQYNMVSLWKRAATEWVVVGGTT